MLPTAFAALAIRVHSKLENFAQNSEFSDLALPRRNKNSDLALPFFPLFLVASWCLRVVALICSAPLESSLRATSLHLEIRQRGC
jgi:hypothetical protein